MPAEEYLDLLYNKVRLYQDAFNDPTFAELYPSIVLLIEKKYSHKKAYLLSLENTSETLASISIQSLISEIQRTIELLEKHQLNTQNLKQILRASQEKYKEIQCTEREIQNFIDYLEDKQNALYAYRIHLPNLSPIFETLARTFNHPQMTMVKKIHYFSESNPSAQLQDAALKDAQTLLIEGLFDAHFIQNAANVLTIFNELKIHDPVQEKLQKELDCAIRYANKQRYAEHLKNMINQSNEHHPHNILGIALKRLTDAFARKVGDSLVTFSTRTGWFDLHLSEIHKAITQEIQQLHNDIKEKLTENHIQSLLTRISFLKLLNETPRPGGRKFDFGITDTERSQLLALEGYALNAQQQLQSLYPLRKALIIRCHHYLHSHLSQQKQSPLNDEKKQILTNMLETLAIQKESEHFSKDSIQTFITQFNQNHELLKRRKSICGVQIENQGNARKALNFFQSQTKLKLSQGSTFISEVEEVLLKYHELIDSLGQLHIPSPK